MRVFYALLFLLFISGVYGQVPFKKGVNFTRWFQADSPHEIQFSLFTRQDFEDIRALGMDAVRLPVNLHKMTSGAPDYQLDPLFLYFLDQVADWAESLQIYLVLDNHTFSTTNATDPKVEEPLLKVWKQMAAHYKNRSAYILYEVLNEPHGIDHTLWGLIQKKVIETIRTEDPDRKIIVGGADFNGYDALKYMPVYDDPNLIYTFHFYAPFVFTHQGASWPNPSMVSLAGVPFPYQADRMPAVPADLKGTWIESRMQSYAQVGTVEMVKSMIDEVVDFRAQRNVPVYCGELGVLMPNSPPEDRVFWYQTVIDYLNEKEIPWTSWDYTGGFGLFEYDGNDLFDHDLNVNLLEAMGLNVPLQSEYQPLPNQEGLMIYQDYTGEGILQSNSREQEVNLYDDRLPNNGKYCIYWNNAIRYQRIGFDLFPDQDLSYLADQNFGLAFMVRGKSPGFKFDVRFLDTNKDETDHPWRIRYTIDENMVDWDGAWHKVFIPLKQFQEQGSWEDGTWYNPEGKFSWQEIDHFEIIAEHQALSGGGIWFDNIYLTDLDTATVNETEVITSLNRETVTDLKVYPNPVEEKCYIQFYLPGNQMVAVDLMTITGKLVTKIQEGNREPGLHLIEWQTNQTAAGIYLIRVKGEEFVRLKKIVLR